MGDTSKYFCYPAISTKEANMILYGEEVSSSK